MKPGKEMFNQAQSLRQQFTLYLRMLFDFSFSEFITIQMTPVLYGISLAGVLTILLYLSGEAFLTAPLRGLFYFFVITPVGFVSAATVIRALMEFYLVVFRIAENVNEFVEVKVYIEKLSGLSDTMNVVTNRIPFWKLLTRRPPTKSSQKNGNSDERRQKPRNPTDSNRDPTDN